MCTKPKPENGRLTPEESKRLDNLLSAARRFHYVSFVLAGLSVAMSSLEELSGVSVPLGDITLPKIQAAVGLYVIVIVLVIAADQLFLMAYPWLKLDPRRPPFAWLALGSGEVDSTLIRFWLMVPVLACAISTASILQGDVTGFGLSLTGVLIIFIPRTIDEYWHLIRHRSDHRGGRATYSMFLLYWYRMLRTIIITVYLFVPVLAVVPKWRTTMLNVAYVAGIAMAAGLMLRLIASFSFLYKRIDRFGARFGFPAESEHY